MILAYVFIFVLGVFVGGLAARRGLRRRELPPQPLLPTEKEVEIKKTATASEIPQLTEPNLLKEPLSRQKEKKEANKKIILQVLEGNTEGITEDDAERLLGVSDATVERYMEELEKEGKIYKIESADEPPTYRKA